MVEINVSNKQATPVIIATVIFSILLIIAAISYCPEANSKVTLSRFDALNMDYVFACKQSDEVCDTKVILLQGEIVKDSVEKVKAFLEKENISSDQNNMMICLDSPGGNRQAAVAIGEEIARRGLDTCLAEKYTLLTGEMQHRTTVCASACPYILLSGEKRIAIGEALIIAGHSSGDYLLFCGCTFKVGDSKDDPETIRFFNSAIRRFGQLNPLRIDSPENYRFPADTNQIAYESFLKISVFDALNKYQILTTVL